MAIKTAIMTMEKKPPVAVSYRVLSFMRKVIGCAKKSHDFRIYLSFAIFKLFYLTYCKSMLKCSNCYNYSI